ncbi:MAG TPA: DnaA regulatory inactivator Hda [Gammaproteobacteria bacterium]|jgi:DnaA family protein|nr:DnaA regulatory inactivator Hda [Gammaproteobacteria bacterium]
MPLSLPQLTLALFDDAQVDLEDFVPGQNQLVVDAVARWSAGDGPWFLMLWGRSGTGKSHLIEAAVRATGRDSGRAMYIPLTHVLESGPSILDDLESIDYLAIDDMHIAAGDAGWERALFNLFNRTQDARGRLLVSSANGPSGFRFELPDLRSRLNSGLLYQLVELGDAEKQLVLQKRAASRGLSMPDTVASYLIRRLRRNMHELNTIFDAIDAASLSAGRELTIPFVRDVLGLD